MQLFYDLDIVEGLHELRQEEALHAGRVLRKRVGDTIDIVNGKGGWYRAEITGIGKKHCTLRPRLIKQEPRRAAHALRLLVAPTKNIDRFEWVLEKATEIGVDLIQPIFTEHSERTRIRLDRLQRVVESAMKQSLRAWMPRLEEPLPLTEALSLHLPHSNGYLAYLGKQGSPLLGVACKPLTNATVAIGPEGGFSVAEAATALKLGYRFVSLGPHRLRTETAAIAAVHTIESLNWSATQSSKVPH